MKFLDLAIKRMKLSSVGKWMQLKLIILINLSQFHKNSVFFSFVVYVFYRD